MSWIRVKERLPPKDQKVLICGEDGIETARRWSDKGYFSDREENAWTFLEEQSNYQTPIHWMPLPEPPK